MLDHPTLDRLRAAAALRFPPLGVLAAYVHGSRVSGRALPSSDLDVGYYLEGHLQGAALPLDLELRAADALSQATGLEIDLRNLADAPLDLRGRVLEEGIRIYSGDDVRRVALERDLLGRYHDYKEELRQMHELRLRHAGTGPAEMVDKAKLDQMLSSLRMDTEVLRGLGAVPREDFLANPDKVGNAKYHFVIGIECSIDIANHIIASENYRFPKDNADSFLVLIEQGLVDRRLEEHLRAMARFRNRLVHLYWEVEDARIHEYLQTALGDLDAFAQAVAGHRWQDATH